MHIPFRDRAEAGRLLAERLLPLRNEAPVVLALPRGGVPVAAEIARALDAPLDLLMVRKIGLPSQPELAVGAIVDGADPDIVVNDDIARHFGYGEKEIAPLAERELEEIERRRAHYMHGRPPHPVENRVAIIIDDGIATGATVRAAVKALRRRNAARIVIATPVAPASVIAELERSADEVVCLAVPEPFLAVGNAYLDFTQVDDAEVVAIIEEAAGP
jgi:predicted phosphoribosyltransferase